MGLRGDRIRKCSFCSWNFIKQHSHVSVVYESALSFYRRHCVQISFYTFICCHRCAVVIFSMDNIQIYQISNYFDTERPENANQHLSTEGLGMNQELQKPNPLNSWRCFKVIMVNFWSKCICSSPPKKLMTSLHFFGIITITNSSH